MTGLQFAMLRALAETFPTGSEDRRTLARMLRADLPRLEVRKTGRALAFTSGLLSEDGLRLTPAGKAAALALFSRLRGPV